MYNNHVTLQSKTLFSTKLKGSHNEFRETSKLREHFKLKISSEMGFYHLDYLLVLGKTNKVLLRSTPHILITLSDTFA